MRLPDRLDGVDHCCRLGPVGQGSIPARFAYDFRQCTRAGADLRGGLPRPAKWPVHACDAAKWRTTPDNQVPTTSGGQTGPGDRPDDLIDAMHAASMFGDPSANADKLLTLLFRGDVTLALTWWLYGALVDCASALSASMLGSARPGLPVAGHLRLMVLLPVVDLAYGILISIAIWRSAAKCEASGPGPSWHALPSYWAGCKRRATRRSTRVGRSSKCFPAATARVSYGGSEPVGLPVAKCPRSICDAEC